MKKRIALGVVAALAGGLLAAAPASAATAALFKVVTAEKIGTDSLSATAVAGAGNYIEIGSIADTDGSAVRVAVSGSTFVDITEQVGDTSTTATWSYNAGLTSATSSNSNTWTDASNYQKLRVATPAAGTITITVYKVTDASGSLTETLKDTITITVNATATKGILSTTKSKIYSKDTTTNSGSANETTTADATGVDSKGTGVVGIFTVWLKDANGDTLTAAANDVTVTVAGPGLIAKVGSTPNARVISDTSTAGSYTVALAGDGTAGKTTLTFASGTTTIGTASFTFYGAVKTITATLAAGSVPVAATGITVPGSNLTVVAKDVDGNIIPSASVVTITSADTTVAAVAGVKGYDSTDKAVYETITGVAVGSTTLTVASAADSTIKTTVPVTVGKTAVNTVALSTDKASYAPGEKVTVTLTATDADGKPVANGTYAGLLSAALTASAYISSTLFAADVKLAEGKATATFYAPLTAGDVTVAGKVGTGTLVASATQGTAVTTVAKVVVAASAAETANAAAIATLNTAVATLQTTVASLVASMTAQIKVINAALVKIAKKLKVKI